MNDGVASSVLPEQIPYFFRVNQLFSRQPGSLERDQKHHVPFGVGLLPF
jgi:hypothetical protein